MTVPSDAPIIERLEISQQRLMDLSPDDWKWCNLTQHYLMKLLKAANDAGLRGRRIKEIRGYEMIDHTNIRYVDFVCEDA